MWLPYVYLSRVNVNRKQPGIMGGNYGFKNRNGANTASATAQLSKFVQDANSKSLFFCSDKSLPQAYCEDCVR